MTSTVAIYGSHNASIALAIDDKIVRVVEIERLVGYKNMGLFFYLSTNYAVQAMHQVHEMFKKEFGIKEYDLCIHQYAGGKQIIFPAKEYIDGYHHESHACNSLYQSKDSQALIFSFDGGGQDKDAYVFFRAYKGKKGEQLEVLETVHYDLGFPYMTFGHYLSDIRKEPLYLGNLVYSGKIMGLCGYGKVREHWLPYFEEFYKSNPDGPEGVGSYIPKMEELGKKCGVKLFENARIEGELGWDIAATSQKAFENVVLSFLQPHMSKYANLPVHMAGGCGLNILLNTRLKEEFGREVFVAPNPNDCGLAVGMLCKHLMPKYPVEITYAGPEVFDRDLLEDYAHTKNGKPIDFNELSDKLISGSIIGVVRGNCEHGPRALGNRSILCNPAISGMKDILNAKVKNRECYDDKTEILTKEGWKLFKDILDDEIVATLNPEINSLEYQQIEERIEYDFEGEMISFKNKRIDLMVTPNHKVWSKKIKNHNKGSHNEYPFELEIAENLLGKEHVQQKTANFFKGEEQEYFHLPRIEKAGNSPQIDRINTDLWLEFLGYYLSEGSTTKDKTHYFIHVTQSKKRTIDKFKNCLDKTDWTWKYYGIQFRTSNKQLFTYLSALGKAKDKYIPREFLTLSHRQLNILFEALMLGDGHKRGKQYKYTTISRQLANDVSELGVKLGYSVTISTEDREENNNLVYYVRLNKGSKTSWVRKHQSNKEYYKGKVYCVKVPQHHILCVRRNDKVVFSGNSYRPFAPVVRLEDVSNYFEWNSETRWMSFCPKIREEYREALGAVMHVDGTARVQTVTETQNPYLYQLLTSMADKGHIPVLLNTSFNIAGKPILNSYRDAFWVLENTQMDGLLLENYYFGV